MANQELKVMARVVKKNPEEKLYLICIRGAQGEPDQWDIVEGRSEAYNYIKQNIESMDIENSFILVETTILKDRKPIYDFMKYAEQFFEEDSFDIEDYVVGDHNVFDNDEELEDENISSILAEDRISMKDIMNNNIDSEEIE